MTQSWPGPLHDKGESNGHDHPRDTDEVAIASVARRAERLQGQDETDGRKQVYARQAIGTDMHRCDHGFGSALSGGCLRSPCWRPLNMSSIRSVTTTPPTMLSVARNTATKARTICNAP